MEVSVTYAPLRTELCQGRTRCRGTPIAVDLLCWKIEAPEFEDPQFLHWGCGTPGLIEVLVEGGKLGIERLSASDIYRVERAIRHERIPADDVSPDAFIFDYDLELAPHEKPSRIKGKVTLAFMSKVDTEIEGTAHYGGEVRVGEHVSLQREENEHDSFSIAVVNLQGKQVGHVPAFIAHRLAPLLDRKWVYPVAIAAASTIREDTSRVPMLLKLYSTEANRDALGPLLAKWSEIKNPVELPPPRKSATLGWHGTSTAIWR